MGMMMVSVLVSIVVAHYENKYLKQLHHKPLVWKRYIDDVLTIWLYLKHEFQNFLTSFNGL